MSEFEIVVKVGSMALIDTAQNDIDYNIIARISRELKPGRVLVTSGAAEIGRLDYIKRNNAELKGLDADIKTDYAAQGQSILMQNYRQFADSRVSLRQILVEHQHFNDPVKRGHLLATLRRCPAQNAVPIINYNDPVSDEESRRLEIQALRAAGEKAVECVDNDETASQIATLVCPKYLVILSSLDGIFYDPKRPETLIREISGKNTDELIESVDYYKNFCDGASRKGANGARAKLEFIKEPLRAGTTVIIASSKYRLSEIVEDRVPNTRIGLKK